MNRQEYTETNEEMKMKMKEEKEDEGDLKTAPSSQS